MSRCDGRAAILLLAALATQVASAYLTTRLVSGYRLRTRLSVVAAYQRADWAVQAQEREGWLRTLTTENVNEAATGLRSLADWLKGAIGTGIFVLGALVVNPLAVLIIIVVLGVVMLGLRPLNKYGRRLAGEVASYNVEVGQELAVLTLAARELKMYGVVGEAAAGYRRVAGAQRDAMLRANLVAVLGSPIFRTAASLLIVGLIAYAAMQGGAEIAAIGLIAVLLYRSSNYGSVLVSVHQKLVQTLPSLDQLEGGMDKLRAGTRPAGSEEPERIEQIEARDVTFTYPGSDTSALAGVSFRIERHEVVGIVGPSGAGKSTLADLLAGMRHPTVGDVVVDETPLEDIAPSAMARCVCLVSQSTPLIPATLGENVRFFRELDDDRIVESLHLAGLDALVDELEQGTETMVGPGARALSGGQAQRLGIARALAGDPSIIILDEPTSALDAVSERIITDTIEGLRGHVGVGVIAHRLSTLKNCDRIVVIEDGRLSGEGTFGELARSNDFLTHAISIGRLDA